MSFHQLSGLAYVGDYKYKAFISYSHKDRKWTRWLHRRLETYPIPKNIIGNVTSAGPIPKRLKPIFRDREELSASNNLGGKIEAALASSQSLIIICSPSAAKSKWVNQEILTFKRNNRDAQLFSVIVEGEPYASEIPGRETEECFPPALRYEVNSEGSLSDVPAEPLAADLRHHADGKRLGFLKLLSGMIGVGLDEVVQRDMRRSRKRVTTITSTSLATVVAMGTLTGFALNARLEAEIAQAEAEAGRNDAEESIEFMLTDLKPELEKVGRLGALKVIGKRAETYYDKYPISKHSDEALGRRARVFHFLGEVLDKEGELQTADKYFKQAYAATEVLLDRNPEAADRVFEHAQSAYWVGYLIWKSGNYKSARPFFEEYIEYAEVLRGLEPNKLRSLKEITYAYSNLATLLFGQEKFEEAYLIYKKSITAFEGISNLNNSTHKDVINYADALGWLADAAIQTQQIDAAVNHRLNQLSVYENEIIKFPNDKNLEYKMLGAKVGTVRSLRLAAQHIEATGHLREGLPKSIHLFSRDFSNSQWGENLSHFLYEAHSLSKLTGTKEFNKIIKNQVSEIDKRGVSHAFRRPKKFNSLKKSIN